MSAKRNISTWYQSSSTRDISYGDLFDIDARVQSISNITASSLSSENVAIDSNSFNSGSQCHRFDIERMTFSHTLFSLCLSRLIHSSTDARKFLLVISTSYFNAISKNLLKCIGFRFVSSIMTSFFCKIASIVRSSCTLITSFSFFFEYLPQ